MSQKKYIVNYYLVYENGSKLSQGTTLLMESPSEYDAIRQIRSKNNLTSNVKNIEITKIVQG
jgi:hypothetical protein